jgi:uncharacterized repeat protein (TIGR01451 family)
MLRARFMLIILVFLSFLLLGGVRWEVLAAPQPPAIETPPERPLYDPVKFNDSLAAVQANSQKGRPQPIPEETMGWTNIAYQEYDYSSGWDVLVYIKDWDRTFAPGYTGHDEIQPRLSDDCSRTVFSVEHDGKYMLELYDNYSTETTWLTEKGDDFNPYWSPDGTKIVFAGKRKNQFDIYVINVDGSNQTQLTNIDTYEGQPSWSPDGSKIAFVSDQTGGYRIWVMNADGSGMVKLSGQAYSAHPDWSPDGSQIAYDADGDGDGWQEIWVMSADGSNQHQVYKVDSNFIDAYVGNWAPSGEELTFTRAQWVYYGGQWYLESAGLEVINIPTGSVWDLISWTGGYYMNPDWRSPDHTPPVTNISSLPDEVPYKFQVQWSATDEDSGVWAYDIQVRDGTEGTWNNLLSMTTDTSTEYTGVGGHTYYFRGRAHDHAGLIEDWPAEPQAYTTIEAKPPTSSILDLPQYSQWYTTIIWNGLDFGGSGLNAYDIQYRVGDQGVWLDWMTETTSTVSLLSGTLGDTYYFRSRAIDNAYNIESWPKIPDAFTTFYAWAVSGKIFDNAGTPVEATSITTQPGGDALSNSSGEYGFYSPDLSDFYTIKWEKAGYENLPDTQYAGGYGFDATVDVVMPPMDNIIDNWDFEEGGFSSTWITSGEIAPAITADMQHTGNYSARLANSQEILFGSPIELSESFYSNGPFDLIVDEGGTSHIIWSYSHPDTDTVYYSQVSPLGEWSEPIVIPGSTSGSKYPHSMMDSQGNLHVLWEDQTRTIYYALRDTNGQWTDPTVVTQYTDLYGRDSDLSMAIDAQDHVHIIWRGYMNDEFYVYYAFRDDSGHWSIPTIISDGYCRSIESLQLIADPLNGIHAVWFFKGDQGHLITYAMRNSQGVWQTPEVLPPEKDSYIYPIISLAVSKQGNPSMVWSENSSGDDFTGNVIEFSERKTNGVWTYPKTISFGQPRGQPEFLYHIIDADGFHHIIAADDYSLFYIFRDEFGIWHDPVTLEDMGDQGYVNWVAPFCMDDTGNLFITWTKMGLSSPTIELAQRTPKGAWLRHTVANPEWGGSQLNTSLDSSGNLRILWIGNGLQYAGPPVATQSGESHLSQSVVVPADMSAPTLSFFYKMSGPGTAGDNGFSAEIDDGNQATTLIEVDEDTDGWKNISVDLSAWAGQSITLTFTAHQTENTLPLWAYVDEVSIGSAHPDTWLQVSGRPSALPGEQIIYRLSYGNRGGVSAQGTVITYTLPAGLSFVEASLPPDVNGNVLSWQVGDLPAHGETSTILLTLQVDASASRGSDLISDAEIGSATDELELLNNTQQVRTYVGDMLMIPLVWK